MSVDPARLDYAAYKFGRPMLATDAYDPLEWQAFQAGWMARDADVHQVADVGRRVLYGLVTGNVSESWFVDRDALRTIVTTPLAPDPPDPPSDYTPAQTTAYTAGWTIRTAEVQPIFALGTDVLAGLSDGRATAADRQWMAERDQLRAALGVT